MTPARAMAPRAMNEEWGTPDKVFAPLHREFGFTIDGAANGENAKLPRWCGPGSLIARDGLLADWSTEVVWLNPPYGHSPLDVWMAHACLSALAGATVVCLVPAHTGQKWFHRWVLGKASEIRWLRGKICFLKPDGSQGDAAPFASCIVIYRPPEKKP